MATPTMSIEEVLKKLHLRQNPSPVTGLEDSEETYDCLKCKDKHVIIYRVHYKAKWHEETRWINGNEVTTMWPDTMVTENDFYAGKVCEPKDAWEWRDTFSKRCDCIQIRKIQRLLKSSDITEEFKSLNFTNFLTDGKPQVIVDAYDCATEYLQEFQSLRKKRQNSIALLGQPGCGKTHLLTAISNNLINYQQVPVLYFPFVEGFNDLKDDFDKLEEKLDRMKKVDVLFIDDLFKPVTTDTREGRKRKPRATEWQIEQTYAVINYRYLNHLPILISSELTIDELVEMDEALGTRIFQMCQDFVVVIQGDKFQLNHRLEGINGH